MDLKILAFVLIFTVTTFICYYFSYKKYVENYKHINNTHTNCVDKINSKCDHLKDDIEKEKCLKEKKELSKFEPNCKDVYVKKISTFKKLAYIFLPILLGLIVATIIILLYLLI